MKPDCVGCQLSRGTACLIQKDTEDINSCPERIDTRSKLSVSGLIHDLRDQPNSLRKQLGLYR